MGSSSKLLCSTDVATTVTDLTLPTGIGCEQLTATQTENFSSEDDAVTLSCKYFKQISASDDFFWYRQHPGEPPEFLLYISGNRFIKLSEALRSEQRFSANVSRDRVDLQISSATVADSAVYYCAVRPTVTGNQQAVYKNTTPSSWKSSSQERPT